MKKSLGNAIIFFFPFLQIITIFLVLHLLTIRALPGRMFDPTFAQELYLSAIRQGMQGHWSMDIPYINTPMNRVFGYHLLFIFLGHINRVLQIDLVLYYQLTQILIGIVFLITTYVVLHKLLPKTLAILGYFFITAIETGFYLSSLSYPLSQWTSSFPLQHMLYVRHFGFTHHSLGKALGLVFFYVFLQAIEKPKVKYLLILMLSMGAVANILPSVGFVLLLCVVIPYSLIAFFERKIWSTILVSFLSFLSFLVPTILLKIQLDAVPILAVYSSREKMWWTNQEAMLRYASSLLLYYPLFVIALIGIFLSWKTFPRTLKKLVGICLVWLILPIFLIQISTFSWFPVANLRLVDGTQYFPAGLLVALGLWGFRSQITNLLVIGTMILSLLTSSILVNNYVQNLPVSFINIYPNTEFWQAITFFQKVPENSSVLINTQFGEVLPGYAPIRLYIAASGATWPYYDERLAKLVTFYEGELSDQQALDFLQTNTIDYIYYGIQERSVTKTPQLYPNILQNVYHTNVDDIFMLKKPIQ